MDGHTQVERARARQYDRHDSRCVSRIGCMRWPSYGGDDTAISLIRVCSMSIYVGTYATPDDSPATSPELDEIVQTDADL